MKDQRNSLFRAHKKLVEQLNIPWLESTMKENLLKPEDSENSSLLEQVLTPDGQDATCQAFQKKKLSEKKMKNSLKKDESF